MRKSLFIISFLLLSSCKTSAILHPYTKAPETHTSTWVASTEDTAALTAIEITDELFLPACDIDNSLGDLFDIALHNNPSTKSTWSEARAAAAAYGENLSSYLPTIDFDAQFNTNREGYIFNNPNGESSFLMNNQIQYGPIVTLSYLLYDSGERKSKAAKYFWALQKSNFLHNENVQSVMKTVADNYYTYISDEAQYNADLEDLKDAEESYKAASDKHKAGILAITDMLQAKTNYLQKKVNLTNQKNIKENSYAALITTLSIPSSHSLHLTGFPKEILPCPFKEDFPYLFKIAKKCRGEYLAAKANVLSAEKDLAMAKAEVFPKLALTANGGEYWYQDGYQDEGNYNIQLDFTIPLFAGYYFRNQIKNKKALLADAKASLFETELTVVEQIRIAMNDLTSSKEKIKDTKSYLEAAEIEYSAMFKRYKHGIVTILDLLSSQAFLADARAQHITAQKEYYTSIISLSFATGVLSTQNTEPSYEK